MPKLPPPEIAMILTAGNSLRMHSIPSTPLIFGMMMSVITTSAWQRLSSASGSVASPAVRTEYPARVSTRSMASRTSSSSSTTRTLCIFASRDRLDGLHRPIFWDCRKINSDRRPLARFGLDHDVSTEAFDDAMNDRQPEPRADTDGTCGEERLEYAFGGRRIHAMPGIAHPEFDACARAPRRLWSAVIPKSDRQYTLCSLHGLICVGAQIDHQVDREGCIGAHRSDVIADLRANLDARRRERGEEMKAVGYHGPQIDGREVHIAQFAAEGQYLLDHVLCALRRRQHALEVRP